MGKERTHSIWRQIQDFTFTFINIVPLGFFIFTVFTNLINSSRILRKNPGNLWKKVNKVRHNFMCSREIKSTTKENEFHCLGLFLKQYIWSFNTNWPQNQTMTIVSEQRIIRCQHNVNIWTLCFHHITTQTPAWAKNLQPTTSSRLLKAWSWVGWSFSYEDLKGSKRLSDLSQLLEDEEREGGNHEAFLLEQPPCGVCVCVSVCVCVCQLLGGNHQRE